MEQLKNEVACYLENNHGLTAETLSVPGGLVVVLPEEAADQKETVLQGLNAQYPDSAFHVVVKVEGFDSLSLKERQKLVKEYCAARFSNTVVVSYSIRGVEIRLDDWSTYYSESETRSDKFLVIRELRFVFSPLISGRVNGAIECK